MKQSLIQSKIKHQQLYVQSKKLHSLRGFFSDSQFSILNSRFPIPDSRFPIPDSRFPIP
ncbi:MAG: hypothetical protein F6K26_11445 [Moorea sp. SIO2I5]|nr:hypothetical protein [Moorena sp. SIO2I5]